MFSKLWNVNYHTFVHSWFNVNSSVAQIGFQGLFCVTCSATQTKINKNGDGVLNIYKSCGMSALTSGKVSITSHGETAWPTGLSDSKIGL